MCYSGPSSEIVVGAAVSSQKMALEIDPTKQRTLTQAVAKVNENAETATTLAGPVFSELWMMRQDGDHQILLDKGFIQGGSSAHVIGMIGRVAYSRGDYLLLKCWNDSGTNVNIILTTAWDDVDEGDEDPGACRLFRLSTKHEATWNGCYTLLNDGAASGDHQVAVLPTGPARLISGFVSNKDVAARGAYVRKFNTDTTSINSALFFANAALGAGSAGVYPDQGVANAGPNAMDFDTMDNLDSIVQAVAVSQDSIHQIMMRITGRAPTVTITKPAGCTTTTTTNKVIP